MIKACLLVIAGGVAAQLSRLPLSSDLCKFGLVASVVLLVPARIRTAACLACGFFLFVGAGMTVVEARLDAAFAGDSLLTEVRVVDFPEFRGASVVFLVTPTDDRRLPPLSRVSWYQPPELPQIGDTWQLELRLRRPRGASNPAVFDYETWLFRRKVHATGYVVPGQRNRRIATDTLSRVDRARRDFVALADRAAPAQAAVLSAIGVGARHQVSRAAWQRYANTGTSHLMAISGLHVGLAASSALVALWGFFGVLRVAAPLPAALGGSVLTAALYAIVSGLGVPAQRALLMLLLVAVAVARRRQVDAAAVLSSAALAIYLIDPLAAMTPGFNLSFAAVILLAWRARRQEPSQPTAVRRPWQGAVRLAGVQAWLLVGLMPLTILIFRRIAFLSIPANLFAVPVFSFVVVPFTLAALAAGALSDSLAIILLKFAAAAISWTEGLVAVLADLPIADVRIAETEGYVALAVILPALWVGLPRGWPGRRCALLAIVALVVHVPKSPPSGCFDAHVLDVGQGLAVVVQSATRFMVFDTGVAFPDGRSIAEQVVVPFLRSRGARRVDRLIVSHSDIDHSGGLPAIERAFDVGELVAGEVQAMPRAATRCRRGQHGAMDDVAWRMLHPVETGTGNNASCVLILTVGRHALLLTGDIEAPAEEELVERGELHTVDVVVVPHHGSLTSSSAAFVEATAPELAVVSAGYGNRWGFPKPGVVERWQAGGARLLNTATAGAVSVRLCAEGGLVALRRDRHERRRFWRPGVD